MTVTSCVTPTIVTDRLLLRPFSEEHLTERYVAWLNDPAVVRFSELRHRTHDMDGCITHLANMRASGHLYWAIELQDAHRTHIGNAAAYLDAPNRVADVSILIGEPQARGCAMGSEAWCAIVEHLAASDDIRVIEAGTMAANTAMMKLLEKSGMTVTGRRPGHFLVDGTPTDLVLASRNAGSGA